MNCSDPSPVAGGIFSPFSNTTEGAIISFNCDPWLEPQREDLSVCSSNGSWVPDPAHRICSPPRSCEGIIVTVIVLRFTNFLDCGQPVLSPNVSVVSNTGTREGDTVTLLCKDGLFPALPLVISCNRSGVWSPDPAELVCTSPQGELNSRAAPTVRLVGFGLNHFSTIILHYPCILVTSH